MPDKTTKTIRIKWVRSGIGFPRRQKTWVRSLGLTELNQVVERPDTPQIRGLVARAHHLVEILGGTAGRSPLPSRNTRFCLPKCPLFRRR
jgi:large subunit ribosomal protein L30